MPQLLHWTEEEDSQLQALIQEHGTKKWSLIASVLGTKSSKQCRRRWKNVLDMDAKSTTWTADEDMRLIQYHKELGNKWTAISKLFRDRTDNAVKNRWHALCKKQPDLAEEDSPVTTVGVRRGTRPRVDADDDEDDDARMSKRPRRNQQDARMHGAPAQHQKRYGRGHIEPRAAQQTLWSEISTSSGRNTSISLPTPFDQHQQRRRNASSAPISIKVPMSALSPQDLFITQHVNTMGLPFHIQVTDLGLVPDGSSGDIAGATSHPAPFYGHGHAYPPSSSMYPVYGAVSQSNPLPAWNPSIDPGGLSAEWMMGSGLTKLISNSIAQALTRDNPGAGGSPRQQKGGAAPPQQPTADGSHILNDFVEWLNHTSTSAIPHIAAGGSGQITGPTSADAKQRLENQRTARSLGSLPLSSSSDSGGLNSEQRDLLARLLSHAAEGNMEKNQQQNANGGLGTAPMDAFGLDNSLSLGFGSGGSMQPSGRRDPLGRTRSASLALDDNKDSDKKMSEVFNPNFMEAAAAAIAAVQHSAQLHGGQQLSHLGSSGSGLISKRASSRDRKQRGRSGKGGSNSELTTADHNDDGSGSGLLLPKIGGMMNAAPSFDPLQLLAPEFTKDDIDLILDALSGGNKHQVR